MNGVRNYASITHSSFSPTATTRPTSPTPADGRTPAASSPPSPASSARRPAATERVRCPELPHDLAAPSLPGGSATGPAPRSRRSDWLGRRDSLTVKHESLACHISISIRNTRECWRFGSVYGIMFEERYSCRTDVVHASVTGSRGPRVGRGSHLAGPRPG